MPDLTDEDKKFVHLDMDVEITDPNSQVAARIGNRVTIIGKCGDDYLAKDGVNILRKGEFRNLCSRPVYS